jgi:hypothetical protein
MKKKIDKFFYWTPRITVIVFSLFLFIFSFDVFDGTYGFWGTIFAFFMHNLPSLILLAILLTSWRRDLVGGIIFTALGVACVTGTIIALITASGERFNPILIIGSVVFIFTGSLFLVGWYKKRNKKS